MAAFLTDEWIDGLHEAAASAVIASDVRLVIQQVVAADPEGSEVAYVVEADHGRLSVRRGRVEHPDVTFTQDRATALAIHRGEVSAQTAFMDGRLRLGGDLRSAIEGAGALATIQDVFAAGRA